MRRMRLKENDVKKGIWPYSRALSKRREMLDARSTGSISMEGWIWGEGIRHGWDIRREEPERLEQIGECLDKNGRCRSQFCGG